MLDGLTLLFCSQIPVAEGLQGARFCLGSGLGSLFLREDMRRVARWGMGAKGHQWIRNIGLILRWIADVML